MFRTARSGFTLIELLIILILISLFVVLSVPIFSFFQINRKLDIQQEKLIEVLRLAQNKAQTGLEDSSYGVYFGGNYYLLFKGDSYDSRDPDYDIEYELPDGFVLSGLEEVVFNKITGRPSNFGVLTITETSTGRSRLISVNSLGLIQK